MIASLEESRRTIEREQLEIARYKEEIKTLKSRLEEKNDKIDARREKMIQEASEEAHRILREAKEYADETMKTFHKFGKENIYVQEMEKHRQELRKKMSGAEKKMAMKKAEAPAGKKLSPKDLHLGDAVKVLSMNLKGTVSSLPDADVYKRQAYSRRHTEVSDPGPE